MEKKHITITSLGSSGEGIGSDQGLKIFVENALPGEEVSIEIVENKKNYAKGRLLSILTPSPHRITPPCPYFDECGGCQIMHLDYGAQLEVKRQKIVDALERIGHFSNLHVAPCIASPLPLHYRNKIQLPIVWEKDTKKIGLFKKDSHEVIPIDKCLIQCSQGEKILSYIASYLENSSVEYVLIRNGYFTQEVMVIFVTNGKKSESLRLFAKELMQQHPQIKGVVENVKHIKGNRILGDTYFTLEGQPYIFETILGKTFKISPPAFFQVNSVQAENLFAHAIHCAEINSTQTVVDAYCGVGTLAILASDAAKKVIGIEITPESIENAKENAVLNKKSNISFKCGRAEKIFKNLPPCDVLFLNPPRKGCDLSLITTILSYLPKKIIYISCNPATLARDLSLLASYQIDTVQPYDMFPQTMHVETVVSLSLS